MTWRIEVAHGKTIGLSSALEYHWTARLPTLSHWIILSLRLESTGEKFSGILPLPYRDQDLSWLLRTASTTIPSLQEPRCICDIASTLCSLLTFLTRTDQRISASLA